MRTSVRWSQLATTYPADKDCKRVLEGCMRYIVFNKLRSIGLRGRSYTARTTRYNVPASNTAGNMYVSAPFPAASAVGIRVAVSSVRDGNNPYEDCRHPVHPPHKRRPLRPQRSERYSGKVLLFGAYGKSSYVLLFLDGMHGQAIRPVSAVT